MSTTLTERVRPEWIDYNGHLTEGGYVFVFGYATDALMEHVGLGPEYREGSGCSLYTVEAHVRYLDEVGADAGLEVLTRVVGAGTKKLRLCHEMRVDGALVATEEILALHVDQEQGRAVAFPDQVAERIAAELEQAPEYAGRSISG
ncbi:thioesterase family protein [Nocardiopsis sp. HNM0947]|uniref:Thioesterase family protein n=1 Tax=Nocardiopsis coralli TaxID=2772213 RepID=A0ABR9P2Y5_9ACTN|nr:thioesterase family protein [Nocardiopsis coralli]MBE2998211.1 thioesterase family protein [Nocardiopsis coralli]